MLDQNSLQQLSQLKQSIRADKNLYTGTVRGSQGRYGFVSLDDGREGFLPPDHMSRVIPGDRVEVSVTEKSNGEAGSGKIDVELDKLLSSPGSRLIGQYVVRGKGHFVAVDLPQFNRWIFLAPRDRGKAREGDYVICKLTRHPFEDGKGQARVTAIIGKPDEIGIEHKLACLKHNLAVQWSSAAVRQTQELVAASLQELPDFDSRRNLEHLEFVTIDSEFTLDMDDALHIEETESGWTLRVAIADPTAAIAPGSALDIAALKRASTVYLPGGAVTMLPEALSNETFSLCAGKLRPSLLCELEVQKDGDIKSCKFEPVIIRSRHKLSYAQVGEYLQGSADACPETGHELLKQLARCSSALRQYREQHMLMMDERDDFELVIGDDMHITGIRRQHRNLAQQIVEESMLATNRSAGQYFADHQPSGIFSAHDGFRTEKLPVIKAILEADCPQLAELDVTSAAGYRELIRSLQTNPETAPQLAVFRLMLQSGRLATEPAPHLGLGMQHYATITSPIRRYNDFYNHRALRALLAGKQMPQLSAEELLALQEQISTARNASRDLEQWLFCLFMENHRDTNLSGHVFRVTSQGIMVKLEDYGIVGFVKIDPKAWKFDELRMTLSNDAGRFQLNQTVLVRLERVDLDKKRINFCLVEPESIGATPAASSVTAES